MSSTERKKFVMLQSQKKRIFYVVF